MLFFALCFCFKICFFTDQVRRENKLLSNQLLHSLLIWTGHREDTDQLLNELLIALQKINRRDIASRLTLVNLTIRGTFKGRPLCHRPPFENSTLSKINKLFLKMLLMFKMLKIPKGGGVFFSSLFSLWNYTEK